MKLSIGLIALGLLANAPAHANDIPEQVQAACMSLAAGRMGNGTTVKDISVAYHHSFQIYDFYAVTVAAEIAGKQFTDSHLCRRAGNSIELMPTAPWR